MTTRSVVAIAVFSLWTASSVMDAADEGTRTPYETGVVGLNVTFQKWDEDRPWVKTKPETRRASAVLVGERRILTTADTLDDATFLQLSTFGRTRQGQLRVERIDRSLDLALLALEDDASLEGLRPVALAERTPTSGTLRTTRWRNQQLEVAASRVIRIEVERSLVSGESGAVLHMRTDLAGGGWAEPVFDGEKLVAVTISQSSDESRSVPVELLRRFLDGLASDSSATGISTLGANWQVNRDSAVSRFLGLEGAATGILIRQVPWGSTGCGALKPRDVLLEIGGEAIDAEGYYRHPWLSRIGFNEILAERYRPGDQVPARVLRDGHPLALTLTARSYPAALSLVPFYRGGPPPYVIAGGLVLRELDLPYLKTWGKDWEKQAPDPLLSRYRFETEAQSPERRRFVMISSVLPSSYNVGYQELRDVVIERVNEREIGKIEDVVAALAHPLDGYHVFELSADSPRDQVVLEASDLDAATAAILEEYSIPAAQRMRGEPLPEGGGDCRGDY
jgi:PDZ domain-containing protein